MVQLTRTGMNLAYSQERGPSGALASRFTIKAGGIFNGAKVFMDITRDGEDIATVITRSTGPNMNDFEQFTTKEFEPPSYGEAFGLDVNKLLDRMAGVDPYSAAYMGYQSGVVSTMMKGFMLTDNMITRGVEQQASQILQTGKLSLRNKAGVVVYELDFKPKTSHFPTVTVPWTSRLTSTPMGDVEAVVGKIFTNGKITPDRLTFGTAAWANFKNSKQVLDSLDNRRVFIGEIMPSAPTPGGMIRQGKMFIGDYEFTMYTYPAEYTDPVTRLPVRHLDTNKVIVDSTMTRYDMVCARVPLPIAPDSRVSMFNPGGRLINRTMGYDVTPNVYVSPNGKQVTGELESRPLLVPSQIDGYGCLTTVL